MQYSTRNCERGFTLIELLIAMAIALLVLTSISSAFIMQRKTYDVQEQITEMIQNGRAAMDMLNSEIMMTGYGAPTTYISSWIDWVTGVTMDSNPKIEDGGSGSDIIHMAACFDGPAATLSSDASAGDTTINVTPVDGSVSDSFDTSDEKIICINALENAVVTGVSGNMLTIDTDPNTGGNQGLNNAYDASATTVDICVVKVISYSIVQDDDGSYVLKRNENLGAGRQPLAENIVDLQITQSGNTIEINPLTAQTDEPDPNYSQNSGYRTFSQRAYITPPNLTMN